MGRTLSVTDFRLQIEPAEIPVLVGLAGAIADGVILAFCPPEELPARVAAVHEGAVAAGRDPAALEIAAYVNCQAGGRAMIARGQGGKIINICTSTTDRASGGIAHTGASRAAVST